MGILRGYLAVAVGFGITQGTLYLHEFFHWVFIVPFGGSLDDWEWYLPGWFDVSLSPDPWGSIALYAGGLAAGIFLVSCLGISRVVFLRTQDSFWWWLGLPLAFGAPMEFFAGISEGAFNNFYHSVPFFPLAFLLGASGVFLYWRAVPLRPNGVQVPPPQ